MAPVILKYKNRKLYSKGLSKYVSLSYLRNLVLNNVSFIVVDYETHQDITVETLVTILSVSSTNMTENDLRELIKGVTYAKRK